jgi:hypothetical protein
MCVRGVSRKELKLSTAIIIGNLHANHHQMAIERCMVQSALAAILIGPTDTMALRPPV